MISLVLYHHLIFGHLSLHPAPPILLRIIFRSFKPNICVYLASDLPICHSPEYRRRYNWSFMDLIRRCFRLAVMLLFYISAVIASRRYQSSPEQAVEDIASIMRLSMSIETPFHPSGDLLNLQAQGIWPSAALEAAEKPSFRMPMTRYRRIPFYPPTHNANLKSRQKSRHTSKAPPA